VAFLFEGAPHQPRQPERLGEHFRQRTCLTTSPRLALAKAIMRIEKLDRRVPQYLHLPSGKYATCEGTRRRCRAQL
jgi:hypothetical protein